VIDVESSVSEDFDEPAAAAADGGDEAQEEEAAPASPASPCVRVQPLEAAGADAGADADAPEAEAQLLMVGEQHIGDGASPGAGSRPASPRGQ
jgi:hypothetical protein